MAARVESLAEKQHRRLRRYRRVICFASTFMVSLLPAGCGLSPAGVTVEAGPSLTGRVRGGEQPISGAAIFLYAAGSTGDGSGAVNLLAPNVVTTDANGFFAITGDYTCPSPTTDVYLVARGGNPGLGSGASNSALVMMAALGNCSSLTASSYVFVNEVTTAASAWALSQFIGTDANIGASSTNASGLQNAFAVANNLVNTSTGLSPGSVLPAGAATEVMKIYTFANILSPCVNSDGGAGCAPLFASSAGSGTVPANILDAALNIVRNPSANVSAVFDAGPAQGPYQPVLSSTPHDWTMSISYGGCNSGCGGLNLPGSIAIDSVGDAWIANYFGAVVTEFSPAGIAVAPDGFAGAGLRESYGIAIDGFDNVWVANEQSVTAANNSHHGSISKFSSAGVELSGTGFFGPDVYYPKAIATDVMGDVWIADYASSSASLLANDGSPISPSSGFATSQLPFTSAVALDAGGDAWFAFQGGDARIDAAGDVSSFACCSQPLGIAIDQAGSIWLADYSASEVVQMSSSGTVTNRITLNNGNAGPQGIAVDGAGMIWVANYYGNSIAEISGASATVLSPTSGYGLDAAIEEPYGIAIDASGNLWLSNAGNNTVTQIVGLASPIRTPLLGPPAQP
jgi:streptogramin lyase